MSRAAFVVLAVATLAAFAGGPVSADCGSPLVVASASSSGPTVLASVDNPTSQSQPGYLWLGVILEGSNELAIVSIPLSVDAESGVNVSATFGTSVTLIESRTCDHSPHGVTETPDPVIVINSKENI